MATRFLNPLVDRWAGDGNGAQPVVYLFYDEFVTPELSPITTPRTAQPGPGVLDLEENTGTYDIASGKLISTNVTGQHLASGFTSQGGFVRASGLAFSLLGHVVIGRGVILQARTAPGVPVDSPDQLNNAAGGIYLADDSGDADVGVINLFLLGSVIVLKEPSFSMGDRLDAVLVMRDSGLFFLVKQNTWYREWTLIHVVDTPTSSPLYLSSGSYDINSEYDSVKAFQMGAPWNSDHGIATEKYLGAVTHGQSFTHDEDFLFEYVITVKGITASAYAFVIWRFQDYNNRWNLTSSFNDNNLILQEITGGSTVNRGTISAPQGSRILVTDSKYIITVHVDDTSSITYESAISLKGKVAGEVLTPDDFVFSNLVIWPREISGAALTELERYVQSAPVSNILIDENFDIDDAAPIDRDANNRRSSDGEYGTWTIYDTNNIGSISGGQYLFGSGMATTDRWRSNTSFKRNSGVAISLRFSLDNSGNRIATGLVSTISSTVMTIGIQKINPTTCYVYPGGYQNFVYSFNGNELFIILMERGSIILAKYSGSYYILRTELKSFEDYLYTIMMQTVNVTAPGQLDYHRVVQLDSPWNTDFGVAIYHSDVDLSGGVYPFTHEEQSIYEWSLVYKPSTVGEYAGVDFRKTTKDDRWFAQHRFDDYIVILGEVTGGVFTQRGSTAPVTEGEHIWIRDSGANGITVFVEGILEINYTSSTSHVGVLNGDFYFDGNGEFILSDATVWPRKISGAAHTELEKYVG